MPSSPSAAARRVARTKSSRTRSMSARVRAWGTSSPGECGSADGATVRQPSGASGAICAPPSQGAALDALRPAWLSWIATPIGA